MPPQNERLRHVSLKISRAKEHAANLKQELGSFLRTDPFRVALKHDPTSRKLIYYVARVETIPDRLPLIAGDAIQNLMSGLDHLAYQIVCNDTDNNPQNPRKIYFPIADDAAQYENRKRVTLQGARQKTFDAIDALRPYKGGNDSLWTLYRLNIIEKHRILLTIGLQASGINLGQLMAGHMRGTFPPEAIDAFEAASLFLMPADKGFPIEAGYELYIGAVDEKPNPKQQFRFDVAISEPGIIDGKPLLAIVSNLITAVENAVTTLSLLIH